MKIVQTNSAIFAQIEQRHPWPIIKKMYSGTHPILLIVQNSDLQRAAHWAKTMYNQFDFHTQAVKEFNEAAVTKYITENAIQSVLIIQLSTSKKPIRISTNKHSVRQFLMKYPLPATVTIEQTEANLLYKAHPFVTQFSIGFLSSDVTQQFFEFFTLFLPLHIRLAEHKGDTQIVRYSALPAGPPMPLNKVTMHPDHLLAIGLIENEYVLIIQPEIHCFTIAVTCSDSRVKYGTLRSSLGIRNKLQLNDESNILLHPLKKIEANNVTVQKINHLQDETIFLSSDLYNQFQLYAASHYEVVNPLTGASYDLSRKKLKEDANLKPQTMRINYLTREFLDYEQPPATISKFYMAILQQHEALSEQHRALIQQYYPNNICSKSIAYEDKLQLKSVLKKSGLQQVDLYPLPTNTKAAPIRFYTLLWRRYMRWTIRPAKVKLKVIRPYSTDESSNIVRMTKNAMSLLGIVENDLVTLSYRGKTFSVPVLELNSAEWIRETNIMPNDSNMNISIGIPASLRAQLGMKKIGVVCTVKRNLPYLLKKNQNLQFIPIVATLLAIYAVDFIDTWVKVLLILIFVPLANYISLSDVREKIPKV